MLVSAGRALVKKSLKILPVTSATQSAIKIDVGQEKLLKESFVKKYVSFGPETEA